MPTDSQQRAVIVMEYDATWPLMFSDISVRLANHLGNLHLRIEHIGSTAVAGLAAKPIIDIDVVYREHWQFEQIAHKLVELGYVYQGNLGIEGREAFTIDAPHHLYVCHETSVELMRHLAFRDYLRAHPPVASAYGAIKMELTDKYRYDREAYTIGKTHFITEVLEQVAAYLRAMEPAVASRLFLQGG
ncbi:MAG: GrpB family protein [bacterium]|nr:GrpB family protein [bacterium]